MTVYNMKGEKVEEKPTQEAVDTWVNNIAMAAHRLQAYQQQYPELFHLHHAAMLQGISVSAGIAAGAVILEIAE